MQSFMGNSDPSLLTAQMQPSAARLAIAQQMQRSAMAPQQTDPNNPGQAAGQSAADMSKALIANYLTGQAGQLGAQAKLLGPQNAVQYAGQLA